MQSQIQFDLTNPADKAVMAVLIPATLRRAGLLKGKFLDKTKFKDEAGETEIGVANIVPVGSITELNEYADQFVPITITGVIVQTNSFAQATTPFIERRYVDFKPATVSNIDSAMNLIAGVSAVHHDFKQAWTSSGMKSLEMQLLPGETVTVTLKIVMPDLDQVMQVASAAILPQQ